MSNPPIVSPQESEEGRRQLVLYRMIFEPGVNGWPERGCGGCSFLADVTRGEHAGPDRLEQVRLPVGRAPAVRSLGPRRTVAAPDVAGIVVRV